MPLPLAAVMVPAIVAATLAACLGLALLLERLPGGGGLPHSLPEHPRTPR